MNTKFQQRKNRLRIIDMLENRVTDAQFHMGSYCNSCGTVGCAVGIAVLSGEFGYGAVPPDQARKQLSADTFISSWMPVKDGNVIALITPWALVLACISIFAIALSPGESK